MVILLKEGFKLYGHLIGIVHSIVRPADNRSHFVIGRDYDESFAFRIIFTGKNVKTRLSGDAVFTVVFPYGTDSIGIMDKSGRLHLTALLPEEGLCYLASF